MLNKTICLDGPALDFSYMKLIDIKEILIKESRGKAIQIEKSLEKLELKDIENEDNINKEKTEIKQVSQAQKLLEKFGSSLVVKNKRKTTVEVKPKFVKRITTFFNLGYNQLRSINDIDNIVVQLLPQALENIQWIDLQHNYLTTIPDCICNFKHLNLLYLHANYFNDIKSLSILQNNKNLKTITVHSNPIVRIQNFRFYIIGLLSGLVKIDSVLITKKERDHAEVWKNKFKNIKLPSYIEEDCPKPPKLE